MRRGIVAAACTLWLALPAAALAVGSGDMTIKPPKTMPVSGYFTFKVTGSFDVKKATKIEIWVYEGDCKTGLSSVKQHYTPFVRKPHGSFTVTSTGDIGASEKLTLCAAAFADIKGHLEKVTTTQDTVKSSAT